MYKKPRGTKDLFGTELIIKKKIEVIIKELLKEFSYEEIQTPMFESSNLFNRSLGNDSDIVSKEMYEFSDKKGREFVLRPESTSSVARFMIEQKLINNQNLPINLFLIGSMFRYERPQNGRQREFSQISVESYNSKRSIEQDFKNILISYKILKDWSLIFLLILMKES